MKNRKTTKQHKEIDMAVLTKPQEPLTYESAVIEALRQSSTGLSMDEIDESLQSQGFRAEQSAKEAVWRLVDRGNASFNHSWRLVLEQNA
jgi:hypothetical protein